MKQLNNATISPEALACADALLNTIPLVMASVREQLQQCRPPHLNAPQFRALMFVYLRGDQPLSVLGELLGLSVSSVSKLVDHLVLRGYVRREPCAADRRRVHLRLTARGLRTCEQARERIRQQLADIVAPLAEDGLGAVTASFMALQPLFPPQANPGAPGGSS